MMNGSWCESKEAIVITICNLYDSGQSIKQIAEFFRTLFGDYTEDDVLQILAYYHKGFNG